MPNLLRRRPWLLWSLPCLLGLSWALADEPAEPAADDSPAAEAAEAEAAPSAPLQRYTVAQARERAELMYELYTATFDAMHERYFHADRAVVPARAMEDAFRTVENRTHTQARWISASFTAMNLDHEPQTEFEKAAAKKLAKGADAVEAIEEGYYRRAGSIPLLGSCVSCHSGKFGTTSPAKRFAGLVISIPVEEGAALPADDAAAAPAP